MKPPVSSERTVQLEEFQRKHRTGLLTLLFTDIVGSGKIKQTLGDQAGVTLIQQHHALVREILNRFSEAQVIDTAGDSFFILFARPSDAVLFALRLQARLRTLAKANAQPVLDRIGIHIGEVIVHEGDGAAKALSGAQVDTCARIMSLAGSDQILLSRAAFDNARQALKGNEIEGLKELAWLNHGPYLVRGMEESIEICEVGESGLAFLKAPVNPERAQRQVSPDAEPVLGWRPAIGQRVPNTQWTLEKKLGEGGFGEVWLGRHQTMKERRVFKFCFRADRVRFLKREMTLFRLLKERVGEHPNIVALREVYFDQPPYYVEMDYVEGQDLRTWSEERGGVERVPLETRLEIVAQAAEGLQAAHDAGVIHRDVKPTNILVQSSSRGHEAHDRSGSNIQRSTSNVQYSTASPSLHAARSTLKPTSEPPDVGGYEVKIKLTDFGIGQVVSEEHLKGITRAGFTKTVLADSSSSHTGTQLYMAPELLAGKPASIRSDIYSLGVVLYQLLIGDFRRPVTTDWANDISDPLLRDDLQHCFAGNPNDRFAGAGQLAQNLRALPERRESLAREKAELAARERAAYRRGVMRSAAVAVLVLAIMAGLVLKAMRIARDRRRDAYVSDMGVAWQALKEQQVGRATELVEKYLHRQPWEEDLRGFEWRLLWQRSLTNYEHTFDEHRESAECVVFSPDGTRLATASEDRTVIVWDVATKKPLMRSDRLDGFINAKALAFSPDGRLLAAKGERQLRVWRTDTWQEVKTLQDVEPIGGFNSAVVFSPDSSTKLPSLMPFSEPSINATTLAGSVICDALVLKPSAEPTHGVPLAVPFKFISSA